MSYKISIAIICVPSRYEMAKNLMNSIVDADIKICCDVLRQGSWYGTRQGWITALKNNCTHCLTLEEDVVVCKDFYPTIMKIVETKPNEVISLFELKSGSNKNEWARKRNYHWAVGNGGASGQAVMMPKNKVIDFLRWSDALVDQNVKYEDVRLWGWMWANKMNTWYTVPSIVEHDAPTQSSLGFNNPGKVSFDFIGKDASGLDIDWSLGIDADKEKVFNTRWEGWEKRYTSETFRGKIIR